MNIYSIEHNDFIGINKKLYENFIEDSKSKVYFDEEGINALVYHLYTSYEDEYSRGSKEHLSKERLLKISSSSLDFLQIDELLILKPHQLFELLDDEKKDFIEAYSVLMNSSCEKGLFNLF